MRKTLNLLFFLLTFFLLTGLHQTVYSAPQSRLPDNFYILDFSNISSNSNPNTVSLPTNTLNNPTTTSDRSSTSLTRANSSSDTSYQKNKFINADQVTCFYIIIPNGASSPSKDVASYQQLKQFVNSSHTTNIQFPTSFFGPNKPAQITTPTIIYFDWEDAAGMKKIQEMGALFKQGISSLQTTFPLAQFLIVSLGRAGLIINTATHNTGSQDFKKPLDMIIEIGTPYITQDQYPEALPDITHINKLFLLYSKQPLVVSQPTLHPKYQTVPPADFFSNSSNSYELLVLRDNKQPTQDKLYIPLLGNSIITICQTAQTNFKKNKNLFVHLSTMKPATNLLVGIIPDNSDSSTKQSTTSQELRYSDNQLILYKKSWGVNPPFDVSAGEYMRNTYKAPQTK